MDGFFFRVDHDLLRSESFQSLGGSAIKVYLTIGLYSDFGTGWAYPSVRTIARQAGLSRQTVLVAIEELTTAGLLAANRAAGKSNAYKVIRQAPRRPTAKNSDRPERRTGTGPESYEGPPKTVPKSFQVDMAAGPIPYEALARFFGPEGREAGPKRDPETREEDNTARISIPGTPFQLEADGRLVVAADLQQLLREQGIPGELATKLIGQNDSQAIARVLLNALYLQSQGRLQNGPGYIRAGLEDGYELLPQVASRLEARRRELQDRLRSVADRRDRHREAEAVASEEAAIALLLEQLDEEEVRRLVDEAVASLPKPLVRRNPTLGNPFVRAKVYELAGGEPNS